MLNDEVKLREKGLEEFKNWFLEKETFLKILFKSSKVRMSFEYIPSFLIACYKNNKLRNDVLNDLNAFNLFELAFKFLVSVIDDLQNLYNNVFEGDINKLEKISETLYLYFLLKDVFIAYDDKKIPFAKKIEMLPDLYMKIGKSIFNGACVSNEDIKLANELLEIAISELEDEFKLLNDFIYEITLELNIPIHELTL